MVRVLASQQCGPDSNPRPGVINGLSLLLVFVHGARVFLPVSWFSSLHKNQHVICQFLEVPLGLVLSPLHDPVTWYKIQPRWDANYTVGLPKQRVVKLD